MGGVSSRGGGRSITFNTGRGARFYTLPLSGNAKYQRNQRPRPPPGQQEPVWEAPPHWLWRIHSELAKAVKNAEAAPAPAQASEPPEADPRAWMKSHLYWVAQTSSDLHLRRDFPRYKTMLDGWDSQSLSWQANKAAMAEHFGVTTKDLRREWGEVKRLSPEEQGSRAQP